MPYFTAEVYFDESDLTDDEVLEEVRRRNIQDLVHTDDEVLEEVRRRNIQNLVHSNTEKLINDIYCKYQLGQDYQKELIELFDKVLGRVV